MPAYSSADLTFNKARKPADHWIQFYNDFLREIISSMISFSLSGDDGRMGEKLFVKGIVFDLAH